MNTANNKVGAEPVRGTVLLVDDEPTVRKVLKRVLERCGFYVLAAADADQALTVAASHAGSIDLLVTDVVMPATDGHALARMLCEQHPELRVLFVSGYPGSDNQLEAMPKSAEFLHKPFSPGALAEKVAAVLGGTHQSTPTGSFGDPRP